MAESRQMGTVGEMFEGVSGEEWWVVGEMFEGVSGEEWWVVGEGRDCDSPPLPPHVAHRRLG